MTNHTSATLSETVDARNSLNRAAMATEAELLRILTPWLGRKVRKTSGHGGWVAKLQPEIAAALAQLATGTDRRAGAGSVTAWIDCPVRWIVLHIKGCRELSTGGVQYLQQDLAIGATDADGVLVQLFDLTTLRTDYTAAEINAARQQIAELKAQARDLQHQIREFD